MVPEANATEEGGQLAQRFPELWSGATLQERHRLLVLRLEAVYVDDKDAKAVVALQPKPTFRAVFQVATTRADSGVILIKKPPDPSQKALSPCSWWRRGRPHLPQLQTTPHSLPSYLSAAFLVVWADFINRDGQRRRSYIPAMAGAR